MKIKHFLVQTIIYTGSLLLFQSCFNGDLTENHNASSRATPTSVLNHITSNMIRSDEMAFGLAHRTNQYYVSNYSYYWGSNYYNWTTTVDQYEMLKYTVKLEEEAKRQYGEESNVYMALAKFFRAYSAIWFSQRVGDIPMSEAGNPNNLTPVFDTQKDVYKQSLVLLDEANALMAKLINESSAYSVNANAILDKEGDIFGLTNHQWQKVINTFKLRVLISMSKRADSDPDLNVKQQFATILNDPIKYPIMTDNSDNLVYRYNTAYNPFPMFNRKSYTYGANIGKTILDITTSTNDPRTFMFATPAPAQYKVAGKAISDFTAYVGASTNTPQAELYAGTDTKGTTDEDKGAYSYINYKRYYSSQDGSTAEAYIQIGYSEMCFNIAEGIARGWWSGNAKVWYDKGIDASLAVYGLADGLSVQIGDRLGNTLGNVTIDFDSFKNHPDVVFKGNNADGIKQIVTQKYVSMFSNSGFEAFYNWLRTGYPTFQEGGNGIGTADKKLSRRWMYPTDEATYNTQHYQEAISRQYNGKDDVSLNTWLFK